MIKKKQEEEPLNLPEPFKNIAEEGKKDRISAWAIFYLGLFFLIIILLVISNDKHYCKNNPDKCVCEIYIDNDDGFIKTISFSEGSLDNKSYQEIEKEWGVKCSQFRKKTQAELDIDSCNSNPREDDLCKCEEKLNPEFKGWIAEIYEENWESQGYECVPSPNRNSEGELMVSCYTQKKCIKSRPKTDWEIHPENYVAETECVEIESKEITNEQITKCQEHPTTTDCYDYRGQSAYKTICIKNQTTYRLKNECEKGNPDRVEENKTTFIDEPDKTIQIPTKTGGTYIAVRYGFCAKEHNETWQNMEDSSKPFNITFCDYYYPQIKINQTICREKTKEEKHPENLQGCLSYSNYNTFNKVDRNKLEICFELLKQAWKQKGCKI